MLDKFIQADKLAKHPEFKGTFYFFDRNFIS